MEKLNGRQYGAIDPKPITHTNEMAKNSQSSNPFVKPKKVGLIENNQIHRKSRKVECLRLDIRIIFYYCRKQMVTILDWNLMGTAHIRMKTL